MKFLGLLGFGLEGNQNQGLKSALRTPSEDSLKKEESVSGSANGNVNETKPKILVPGGHKSGLLKESSTAMSRALFEHKQTPLSARAYPPRNLLSRLGEKPNLFTGKCSFGERLP
jgi:hypothetical protein